MAVPICPRLQRLSVGLSYNKGVRWRTSTAHSLRENYQVVYTHIEIRWNRPTEDTVGTEVSPGEMYIQSSITWGLADVFLSERCPHLGGVLYGRFHCSEGH